MPIELEVTSAAVADSTVFACFRGAHPLKTAIITNEIKRKVKTCFIGITFIKK